MDPLMDRDLAEINFRPRTKGRKSYTRDSHGFELEKNYFQDASSDEESSSGSERSFTLSLGKDTKQPRQQRTSIQHGVTAMLPSGTRSDRSSRYSPSPPKIFNHSQAKITTNPKKRLTFDMDSNEENRKHEGESVSESEEDGTAVVEEILPGSYSASGFNPTPNRSVRRDGVSTHKKSPIKTAAKSQKPKSPAQAKAAITSQARKAQKGHQKSSFQLAIVANSGKKRQTFDLGEFSTSSSDTDEEVEGIKRSLFVRPVGKETLMCLPKLSEYIKPRQKTIGRTKKETQKAEIQQRQQSEKRKATNSSNVVPAPAGTKRRRKNVHVIEEEMTPVEELTATQDDEDTMRGAKTERNSKLLKKKKAKEMTPVEESTATKDDEDTMRGAKTERNSKLLRKKKAKEMTPVEESTATEDDEDTMRGAKTERNSKLLRKKKAKEMTPVEESTATEDDEDTMRGAKTERNSKLLRKKKAKEMTPVEESTATEDDEDTMRGAKTERNSKLLRKKKAKEMTPVEESTATEDDEGTMRAVRTEQNPKRKKKASSINVKPQSTSKKQKPVTNKASACRHGNRSTSSPVSDSSQKSFAVLHNTTSRIIDSIYRNDEQDVEEDMRNEMEQSPQRVTRCRPSISFTSKGEESRQTRSTRSKAAQNIDHGIPDMTKEEADTTLRRSRKRPMNTEYEKDQNHGTEPITGDQKRQRRRAPKLLSSEGEVSDGSIKVMKQQLDKKKKKDVIARQRPTKEVGINKNKEQLLRKGKEKRSRDAKRRQLIDESRAQSQHSHIPVAKPEPMDDTLRRSSRTRVPRINHLLGEQVIYEASASGGLVVKEIIRPAASLSQYSIFERKPKVAKKQKKHSSRNASQSQSSKPNSKVTTAKEKDRKVTDDTEEPAEEKPIKKSPQKAKKTLPTSADFSNTPVAMVDPITFDDSGPSKNTSNKSKVVNHNEVAENTLVSRPLSPRSKESFGNSLMKSMFQSDSCLATESVEIINDDGTARPPIEVVKPLQSLRLCNASSSMVTPNDPFIMAILSRQKNSTYGIAILNKMGDKGEQYTSDSSVCFFLISGEIMVKIADLELHPPVWSRIYVPEGVTYTLRNLQHTPAVLSYMVIKPNKDHD